MKTKIILGLALAFLLLALPSYAVFNLEVDIPKEYQTISPGNTVFATFKLFNFDNELRKDITIEYWVLGPGGENGHKQETLAIETQASLVRSIIIPPDAPEGEYTLQARVLFDEGREQLSSNKFSVVVEHSWQETLAITLQEHMVLLIIGGIIIVALVALRISWKPLKQGKKDWRLKMKIARIVKRRQK